MKIHMCYKYFFTNIKLLTTSSENMNTSAHILCAFAVNVHVIMVLGTNVSNGSKICIGEELLKSCTRACGTAQCSFNSYCGDDVRCLYCSDEKCSFPPVGCELFCEMRQQGK